MGHLQVSRNDNTYVNKCHADIVVYKGVFIYFQQTYYLIYSLRKLDSIKLRTVTKKTSYEVCLV
jgi:hypothetical protein